MFKKLEYYKPKLQRKSRKKSILSPGQWVSDSSRTGQWVSVSSRTGQWVSDSSRTGQWVSASSRTGQPKPEMVQKHNVFRALASEVGQI
jgi:hypothetical protein